MCNISRRALREGEVVFRYKTVASIISPPTWHFPMLVLKLSCLEGSRFVIALPVRCEGERGRRGRRGRSVCYHSQCQVWWSRCSAQRSASSDCWTGEQTHSAGTQGRSAKTPQVPWVFRYCVCVCVCVGQRSKEAFLSPNDILKILQSEIEV